MNADEQYAFLQRFTQWLLKEYDLPIADAVIYEFLGVQR